MSETLPGPVSMTALRYHTYLGVAHPEGDVYEVAERAEAENLMAQRMAWPTIDLPPAPAPAPAT